MPASRISLSHWAGMVALAILVSLSVFAMLGSAKPKAASKAAPNAADIDPTAVTYKLPDQIKWTGDPDVAQTAILHGDPSKPGLYVVLIKWMPHHFSHPHFHPNDRYITVLSGTWWVGTGTKYDPDSTVAMPTGSYVVDLAKQVHFDGAKDVPAVLEIVGEGPATITPAEAK
ncbi:MAG TPA: cupin domain-containing protein [Candidatus Acidoferrales bacterium]